MKNILIVLLCLLPRWSFADEMDPFSETMLIQAGYFLPEFDTQLRIDNETTGRGADIPLEDQLGLDKQNDVFWGNLYWRFAPNHRLQLGWFQFNRTGDKYIQEELKIGDETYPIGAELHTALKVSVIPITYMYSFVQTDSLEFSGIFGLQWSQNTFDVNGSASIGSGGDLDRSATAKATAPLPVLGLDLNYYITPSWNVGGNLGGFLYKVGLEDMAFQGYVATANINGGFWFSKYVGVGVAVNWFAFNVDVNNDNWKGRFKYQYWGPQAFLTARF